MSWKKYSGYVCTAQMLAVFQHTEPTDDCPPHFMKHLFLLLNHLRKCPLVVAPAPNLCISPVNSPYVPAVNTKHRPGFGCQCQPPDVMS